MSSVSKEDFLGVVHSDRQLQELLARPELLAFALRIAQAAGMKVSAAELVDPSPGSIRRRSEAVAPAADGEVIDFDGDGVPDAMVRGGRWVMLEAED